MAGWEKRWDNMFEQLKEHKQRHGTLCMKSNVTSPSVVNTIHSIDYKLLSQWVEKQKGLYRGYKKGKLLGQIDTHRARRLEAIGFHAVADEKWMKMFEQLKYHKRKYGTIHLHSSTSRSSTTKGNGTRNKLKCWLDVQKRMYKEYVAGRLNGHKDFAYKIKRIKVLDSIGFHNDIDRDGLRKRKSSTAKPKGSLDRRARSTVKGVRGDRCEDPCINKKAVKGTFSIHHGGIDFNYKAAHQAIQATRNQNMTIPHYVRADRPAKTSAANQSQWNTNSEESNDTHDIDGREDSEYTGDTEDSSIQCHVVVAQKESTSESAIPSLDSLNSLDEGKNNSHHWCVVPVIKLTQMSDYYQDQDQLQNRHQCIEGEKDNEGCDNDPEIVPSSNIAILNEEDFAFLEAGLTEGIWI